MKDTIKEKLAPISSVEDKYNLLREYLQALILKHIENSGYIKRIAFVGGTALRFLFDLKRFSEDLDFSLVDEKPLDIVDLVESITRSFNNWNIKIESTTKTNRTVVSSFLKFPDLMYENGLTDKKNQKLFIKIGVDCNPPKGYLTEISFNQKYMPMNIFHYDISSLFAGKLHAILLRQYTKGRDFYDLMWFVGKSVVPNLTLLENAIYQTTGEKVELTNQLLKEKLKKRISDVDFKKAQEEVRVFLANKSELNYFTYPVFSELIEKL